MHWKLNHDEGTTHSAVLCEDNPRTHCEGLIQAMDMSAHKPPVPWKFVHNEQPGYRQPLREQASKQATKQMDRRYPTLRKQAMLELLPLTAMQEWSPHTAASFFTLG